MAAERPEAEHGLLGTAGSSGGPSHHERRRGLWEVLVLGLLAGVRAEERERFRDALRAACARPVTPREAWRLRLAAVILVLLVLQAVTGCVLTLGYSPTADGAYRSVQEIEQISRHGWVVRQLHIWAGRVLVLLVAVNILQLFLVADYKTRGRLKWAAACLLLITVMALQASGIPLSASAPAAMSNQTLAATLHEAPLVGGLLRSFLVGTGGSPQEVLTHHFVTHVVLLPWLLFFVCVIVYSTFSRRRDLVQGPAGSRAGHHPLVPDEALETAACVLFALGAVISLALLQPADLGPPAPPGKALPSGPVDPAFRVFTGAAALAPGDAQDLWTGPTAALTVLFAATAVFFLLPWLDRGPGRRIRTRRHIAACGLVLGLFLLALGLLGSRVP